MSSVKGDGEVRAPERAQADGDRPPHRGSGRGGGHARGPRREACRLTRRSPSRPRARRRDLHHDAALLRERRAAPRLRVHHPHLRHDRALLSPARLRDLLPHRHRRARRQDRRRPPRPRASRRRPTPTASAASSARPGRRAASPTTASSAPPTPTTSARCERSCNRSTTPATSTSAATAASTAPGCERFYTEKELVDGKCPDHQHRARVHRGGELLLPHGEVSGAPVAALIEQKPDLVRPERYRNEVLAMLREPLEDLCISRPKSRLTLGHRAAVRRPLRHLRLVRRPHQLRDGRAVARRPSASARSGRSRITSSPRTS